ncbi:MAG: YggT family protein [Anaerolineales bacterium]|nr:YggT family protein [Anaerolineales bacterium]
MIVDFFVSLVWMVANLLTLIVIVSAILSFILSPYHPVRQAVDRLVDPLLMPIRRVVPLIGMIDISPLIFILLVQFLATAITNLLRS